MAGSGGPWGGGSGGGGGGEDPRGRRPGERITVRDHLPPHAQAYFAHDRAWCIEQAARVGPACAELVEQLLGDRIVERLRGAQGLI